MQETLVRFLGWEDALEKGKATHSSILAWRIPWTVESMGSQGVRHDRETSLSLSLLLPPQPGTGFRVRIQCTARCSLLMIFSFFTQCKFRSVAQSCPTICECMNSSMPGLPVHHQLLEATQTHVYRVGDAIQPSHPLSSPSPPALNLSQHQGLFKTVKSSYQVAKVLEVLEVFQFQHQSYQ